MKQQKNNYHLDDEGIIYRINADGSFTRVGDVRSLENLSSKEEVIAEVADPTTSWFATNHFEKKTPIIPPVPKTNKSSKCSIAEILCYLMLSVLVFIDFRDSDYYRDATFIEALFTYHYFLWIAIFSIFCSIMLSKKSHRCNWLITILIGIGNFSLLVDQEYILHSWGTIFIIPILIMLWYRSIYNCIK